MASFLEDITPIYGTRERNGKGQTLKEFLEEYVKQTGKRYEVPE